MSEHLQMAKPGLKKRFVILGGLVAVLLLGLAISRIRLEREPVYKGKPLSFWLQEFTTPPAVPFITPRRTEAEEAIRHIGTNGLPVFLRLVQVSDDQWKMRLLKLASKQFGKVRYRNAAALHYEARIGFLFLGERGTNAIPDLMRIIEDTGSRSSRDSAEAAFLGMGQAAVPMLLKYFEHRSDRVRLAAVRAVMQAGGPAEILVPAFRSVLNDDGLVALRVDAVTALSNFGAEARAVAAELLALERTATERNDHVLKRAVRDALWKISPDRVSEALVVDEKNAMIVNGAAAENLYMESGGERNVVIWAGDRAPSRAEHWSRTAEGRFQLYRGGNYDGSSKGVLLGDFEVLGVSPDAERIDARIFCAIAVGKVFVSVRNFSNDALTVRRLE